MGKRIRNNLSYLRFTRGRLTQTVVAETTGLGQKTLSALETGASKGIEFSTLLKLCDFFECTPGDLLTIENDPVSPESQQKAKKLVVDGLKIAMKAGKQTEEEIWKEFDSVKTQMQQAAERTVETKHFGKGKRSAKHAKDRY